MLFQINDRFIFFILQLKKKSIHEINEHFHWLAFVIRNQFHLAHLLAVGMGYQTGISEILPSSKFILKISDEIQTFVENYICFSFQ